MAHNFKTSMASAREDVIDDYLTKVLGWKLETVSMTDQKRGIDRIANGNLALEYKTEWRVSDTGNFFIETLSNDVSGKLGWIHYSEAETIVYYIPKENVIYFVPLIELKRGMEKWENKYPVKSARNKTYSSHGIVVPRIEIESLVTEKYLLTLS